MKLKLDILIYTFLIALFSSCTTDYLMQENGGFHLKSSEYEFNLLVEDASARTRAVDFNTTGALRINQVWMGVFDVETGDCVSKSKKILDYKTIQSGVVHPNLLKIYLEKPTEATEKSYVMVAIANYLGVLDENGDDLDSRLMADDLNWNKFNDIAVDVATAYSSPHNGLVPVLAGFVYSNDYKSDSHIKIDQFAEADPNNKGVLLSPQYLQRYLTVQGNSNGYQLTNHTLKLRRLVANINVNIQLTEEALNEKELELTDVSYKRYNMPKGVYIIERRTTNCAISNDGSYTPGYFPTEANLSPNWADLNPADSYYNDSDWQYGNTSGFSFQHFANKHWARNEVTNQAGREARIKYGNDTKTGENLYYYPALADETKKHEDFNNYASYFVVKMHLTDKKTGRALEAEYTIHEGNTSDELGNPADNYEYDSDGNVITDNLEGNASDYIVARNIDYTYNIYINGVDDIYHNVIRGEDGNLNHSNGQGGKVWEFFYVNKTEDMDKNLRNGFKLGIDGKKTGESLELTQNCAYEDGGFKKEVTVPHTGGYYTNAIKLTNKNPDLAFRFYGFTRAKKSGSDTSGESVISEGEEDDYVLEEGHIEGYNYNFPQESFTWLHNLWPPSAGNYSHYFQDYNELVNNPNAIPDDLKNGITIINPDASGEGDEKMEMNLVEFIKYAHNQDFAGDKSKYFDLKVSPCDLKKKPYILKDNYIRTIYIADRKGQKDEDGCTTMVSIFAGAQYPDLDEEIQEAVQLPLPLYRTININNYNIIDQYLQTFSIPVLAGIPRKDYRYVVTIGGQDYSNYWDYENGNYVYKIPMFNFSGTTGTIKLQVIPTEGNENAYEPSEEIDIGNVNLRNHAAWYNTEPEWLALLNNYISDNAGESKIDGGYLRIYSTDPGKKMSRQSENSVYYLKTEGGACTIEFKVYKNCKLTVVARTQNNGSAKIRRVDVKVNGVVTQHELQLKSGANSGSGPWTTVTQNIEVTSAEGALININPAEGGIDIQSVQVSPN